ncbi:MAG: C40 family peptidase [Ignavibacteriales bacterium]|nr:C40 family peptidase [Ignavibacteriales bacterium]
MKNQFLKLTIIIFLQLIFNNCQQKIDMENINSIISEIKANYAPDKRIALFNITPEQDGSSIILKGETNIQSAVNAIIEKLNSENLNVKNEINVLPDKNLGDKIFGIVNISVANIRSEPKHPAELATQSLLGTVVNVLKKENGWHLIQTPDKYISWVDDDGIFLVTNEEMKLWQNSEKVIVTEQYTSAFEKPDLKSDKVSDLVIGNILKKINISDNFTKIEFPDGRTGFIENNNVIDFNYWIKNINAERSSVINSASTFMGLPYLWGGTSSKGFDCSGFTKTVYYLNGIILPRDASQQVHVGELIDTENDFNNLLPGDLLFFGQKQTETHKEKITHVALYIGEGKYIHSSGRVRINSLKREDEDFNEYRLNTFIRAKRILGSFDNGENLIKNNQFYN